MSLNNGRKPIESTYNASVLNLSVATNCTDFFTITGSATKTIKINQIVLSGTRTVSSNTDFLLIKRSSANSGGTFTTQTNVSFDSFNDAATAVVRAYTANPTLGTSIGTLRTKRVFISNATNLTEEVIFTFDENRTQALTLRGTGEVIALNLNATSITGSNFNIYIEWTEV